MTPPEMRKDQDRVTGSEPKLSIDAVIADLATRQAGLSTYIDQALEQGVATVTEITRLLSLHGQNAARLGRLLRDRQALGGAGLDELASAVSRALDELGEELGVEL